MRIFYMLLLVSVWDESSFFDQIGYKYREKEIERVDNEMKFCLKHQFPASLLDVGMSVYL